MGCSRFVDYGAIWKRGRNSAFTVKKIQVVMVRIKKFAFPRVETT